MKKHQKDYLLRYLWDLEKRIESHRTELQAYAAHTGVSVGSIAGIASELASLQVEQRAICFTLNHLGYYAVYENGHVQDIVIDTDDGKEN